jgi:hypothetical protein
MRDVKTKTFVVPVKKKRTLRNIENTIHMYIQCVQKVWEHPNENVTHNF